jgi:CRP-like cAMP-binding protein
VGKRWCSVTTEWADVLAGFPLFAGAGRRALRALIEHACFAEFDAGETVVSKGDPADALFVVLSGSAETTGAREVRSLVRGDYFGELGYLGDSKRSVTVVATGALHVLEVSWEAFVRLAQSDPTVSLAMVRSLRMSLLDKPARASA